MKKRNKQTAKQSMDHRASILRELRAAGLEVAAAASPKISDKPFYSSVSGKDKKVLIVK
ncbi:hypothetical protein [Paenibacillus sophorae]|uniref:Uncharacterized protein n=1 Tax=Paenibacillus sophorae TaxID=1333845 RepID=A0ABX8HEW6_9BACL|nr:hypothetical protein [Paenibacillus sophorae]QWU16795.1 hypothetical protein KP014_06180 [Paenibacillus sophorae]